MTDDLKPHPYSLLFPSMTPDEMADLVSDMEAKGWDPESRIWLYQGQILDGRHRYEASQKAGVEPVFKEFEGSDDDALSFSIRWNGRRRNMTVGQRAAVAAEAATMTHGGDRSKGSADPLKTRQQAASELGVSAPSVKRAAAIKRDAPEVFEAVKSGEVEVNTGTRIAKLPEAERAGVLDAIRGGEKPAKALRAVAPPEDEPEDEPEDDTPAKKAHVAHNSGQNEWYTPAPYVEAARTVMDGIDLDPASSAVANKRVGATTYYTKEYDGLTKEWTGRVWMNPPYAQPLIWQFIDKLCTEYEAGNVEQAVVLVNNGTETQWGQRLLQTCTAVCLHKGRIRFISPDGELGDSPLQGQMIVYLGDDVALFKDHFDQFGVVK